MDGYNDGVTYVNVIPYAAPAVNLFACPGFSVGCGVATFGAGKFSRDQILNNHIGDVGVPGAYDPVSSMIVPAGLVAVFYDRDFWSSQKEGTKVFTPGAYDLHAGDRSWNDRVVSMVVASTVITRLKGSWTLVIQGNGQLSYSISSGFSKSQSETKEVSYSISVSQSAEISYGGFTATTSVSWGQTTANSYTSASESSQTSTLTVTCGDTNGDTVSMWQWTIDGFTGASD